MKEAARLLKEEKLSVPEVGNFLIPTTTTLNSATSINLIVSIFVV